VPPPRPADEARDAALTRWERRTGFVVVLAALAPIIVGLGDPGDGVIIGVALASWAIFVVDLVVRIRLMPGYLRTRFGQMDLAIVILTAPWFLIPGLFNTRYLALLRLIRLTRLLVVSRRQRALAGQLNRVGIFVVLLVASCAFIVQRSDGPADGFDNYGDGLWWAIVTLTTVGYGDLVPTSTVGRLTGALLMISGIAVLGVLAGVLASFFRLQPATRPPPAAAPEDLAAQVVRLSSQVEELNRRLAAQDEQRPPGPPAP
jgi:voltage-gated potassium channel